MEHGAVAEACGHIVSVVVVDCDEGADVMLLTGSCCRLLTGLACKIWDCQGWSILTHACIRRRASRTLQHLSVAGMEGLYLNASLWRIVSARIIRFTSRLATPSEKSSASLRVLCIAVHTLCSIGIWLTIGSHASEVTKMCNDRKS